MDGPSLKEGVHVIENRFLPFCCLVCNSNKRILFTLESDLFMIVVHSFLPFSSMLSDCSIDWSFLLSNEVADYRLYHAVDFSDTRW